MDPNRIQYNIISAIKLISQINNCVIKHHPSTQNNKQFINLYQSTYIYKKSVTSRLFNNNEKAPYKHTLQSMTHRLMPINSH